MINVITETMGEENIHKMNGIGEAVFALISLFPARLYANGSNFKSGVLMQHHVLLV